jgi:hypothetical protein
MVEISRHASSDALGCGLEVLPRHHDPAWSSTQPPSLQLCSHEPLECLFESAPSQPSARVLQDQLFRAVQLSRKAAVQATVLIARGRIFGLADFESRTPEENDEFLDLVHRDVRSEGPGAT